MLSIIICLRRILINNKNSYFLWLLFHLMNISQFIFLFSWSEHLESLLVFTNIYAAAVNILVLVPWSRRPTQVSIGHARKRRLLCPTARTCSSLLGDSIFPPKWLSQLILPAAVDDSPHCSTFSSTFSITQLCNFTRVVWAKHWLSD